MFCKFCGYELNDQAPFCTKCGKPIISPENQRENPGGQAPLKKKKSPIWIAVTAVFLLLLAVIAVLGFLLWKQKNPGANQTSPQSSGKSSSSENDSEREAKKEDTAHLMSQKISYHEDGSISTQTSYTYDSQGRMTQAVESDGLAPYNTITYTYEAHSPGLLRIGAYSLNFGHGPKRGAAG